VGVRIGVKTWKLFVDTTALINTGYETSVPEILIPIAIHTQKGLGPQGSENITTETHRAVQA
jgi:hypothetical protein